MCVRCAPRTLRQAVVVEPKKAQVDVEVAEADAQAQVRCGGRGGLCV